MRCIICNCELESHQVRYAFEEVYCEDCFSENYNVCCRCDDVISRDQTLWDRDGNPYCNECFEDDYDDEAPDNPEVYEADRKLILQLSRDWLNGKCNHKSLIRINTKDYHLQKIKDKVGLVDVPIYLFGLIDREEYQLSVSPNLLDQVKRFILLNGLDLKINKGIGSNRIGVSYSLRKDHLITVIKLIKQLTHQQELVLA